MTTYKEQIEKLIDVLDLAYDLAGSLRDCATGEEKAAFNVTRGNTANAAGDLRRLSSVLSTDRASLPLSGDWNGYIKKKLDLE